MNAPERLPTELTVNLLLRAQPAPNLDHLQAEIVRLDILIETTEPGGERHACLCAAFSALNWARTPDRFGQPSGCFPEQGTRPRSAA